MIPKIDLETCTLRYSIAACSVFSLVLVGGLGFAAKDKIFSLETIASMEGLDTGFLSTAVSAPTAMNSATGSSSRGSVGQTDVFGMVNGSGSSQSGGARLIDNDQADPLGAILVSSVADSLVEQPYRFGEERHAMVVGSGDTLMGLLTEASVPHQDAYMAIEAMSGLFDPRRLQAGQSIELTFNHEGPRTEFAALAIEPDVETQLLISRSNDGNFGAEEIKREFETRPQAATGTITSSLSESTSAAGVPSQILMELIRVYSYAIDFQRDIQPGDRFEVMFEQEVDENGTVVRSQGVNFALLTISGREVPVYRFETEHGEDYYDRSGVSIRRLLMRTPIDGGRMSSGFGMRRHPILGYSRMHQGVDFAAPSGTPIYAAGNGVIDYLAWNGGYGNFVRLRHSGGIQTAYAHLSSFKSGLGRGDRVSQGDVIGYVGTTGQSTGPHLHYEVMRDGQQIDPMSVDLPTGDVLEGPEMRRFEEYVASIDQEFASLLPDRQVAQFSD